MTYFEGRTWHDIMKLELACRYVLCSHWLYEAVVIDHYVLYLKKIDGTDILMVLLLH
jgi:hypothetical protein